MTTYQNGLSALGDPTRRAIFEELARRPRPVGELAERFPVSRPAVSQHLRVLKEAGLVSDRREGSRRLYGAMRACFDRFWHEALAAFEDAAERKGET